MMRKCFTIIAILALAATNIAQTFRLDDLQDRVRGLEQEGRGYEEQ